MNATVYDVITERTSPNGRRDRLTTRVLVSDQCPATEKSQIFASLTDHTAGWRIVDVKTGSSLVDSRWVVLAREEERGVK